MTPEQRDRYLTERYGHWEQPLRCEHRRRYLTGGSGDRCPEVAKYVVLKIIDEAAANAVVVCDRCMAVAVDRMTFHPKTSVHVERLRAPQRPAETFLRPSTLDPALEALLRPPGPASDPIQPESDTP